LPKNDRGESIEIEALEYPGPNLSGSELLKYFQDKLKLDSKLPYSRWSENQGSYTMNAEGISRPSHHQWEVVFWQSKGSH
jgi:hypothetical protein